MFPKCLLLTAVFGASLLPAGAQTTQIDAQYLDDFDFSASPPTNPILDELGIALNAGTTEVGDGDIFQIGYFAGIGMGVDVATFGSSEWGSFTPISSDGGRQLTTIGDAGGISGNMGIFSVGLTLDPALDPELPGSYPVRLAIRFFNDTSLGSSTHFNTVTSNGTNWSLAAPNTPPAIPSFMDLDSPGGNPFVWQSGPGGAFQTVLSLAPEPSAVALLLLGALALGLRRERHA